MSEKKPQLHVSWLTSIGRCNEKWRRESGKWFGLHDRFESSLPSPEMAIGSAVHKAADSHWKKVISGDLTDACQLRFVEAAVSELNGLWNHGLLLDEEQAADPTATLAEITKTAEGLAYLYYNEIAPTLTPLAAEDPWVVTLPTYPFDLTGTFDLRTQEIPIVDLKCMGKTPSHNIAESLQMKMYAWAWRQLFGDKTQWPASVRVYALIKNKVPKLVTFDAVPDDTWETALWHRINAFKEWIDMVKLNPKAVLGADPDHPWVCRKDMCQFWSTCKFWSGW